MDRDLLFYGCGDFRFLGGFWWGRHVQALVVKQRAAISRPPNLPGAFPVCPLSFSRSCIFMKSLRLIENKRCENGEIWKLVLNPIHNLKQWNVFNGNKNVSLGNSVWRLQRVETLGIRIHGARSSSLTAQFQKSKIRFLKNINRFQILIYVTLLTMIVWRNPDILIYWLLLKTCCMNMSVSSPL